MMMKKKTKKQNDGGDEVVLCFFLVLVSVGVSPDLTDKIEMLFQLYCDW